MTESAAAPVYVREDNEATTQHVVSPPIISQDALLEYIRRNGIIDVGLSGTAAVWTVSSAKHGSGVSNLLDCDNLQTFWQSDGSLPHIITIDFAGLTAIDTVCLYLNHTEDESYTPSVIRVRAGTHVGDITEVANKEITNPVGWVMLKLATESEKKYTHTANQTLGTFTVTDSCIWATRLQIEFCENHQNGRDCHVRGVRLLGPGTESAYTQTNCSQHLTLR